MDPLQQDYVKCNESLQDKLRKLAECSSKKLQVVADFDYTLTSFHPTGTCFSAIRTYPGFSTEFLEKTEAIKNKHLPIHVDHTLPEQLRRESDHQWFTKVIQCFAGEHFHRSLLGEMLDASNCRLRQGVSEFLDLCQQHGIPVLIVSGGISDVIEVLLTREGCYYDNITIIANKLSYDNDGIMIGAEEPYLTASTKLDVVRGHEYFSRVKRDNLLLLGDMLSDLRVGECVTCECCVSVGFCHSPERDLSSYCSNFDCVLLDNPGFDVVNNILKRIILGQ